jgi:GNAT superfamily N-acetyltransferase
MQRRGRPLRELAHADPLNAVVRTVIIERLGPDDVMRARDIRSRALADAPDAFWETLGEETARPDSDWTARLAAPDAATFVASIDGGDVGLVFGSPHHEHAGDAGLYSMWVSSSARGRGVGEALINAVIEWARVAGHPTVRLDVGDANLPAQRLYERTGFVPTGVTGTMPPPREYIAEHELVRALTPAE